jgi:transporter family-2 protein
MTLIAILIALAAGLANPVQAGANAELNKQLGQPLWAAIVVYASGLAGLLLIQAFARQPLPTAELASQVHPWAWLGGVVSIIATVAGLMVAQKLGSGVFTGITVTASLLCSLLLDQKGWLGFRVHTASPARLAGGALMLAGLWMIARF